jgi:hypothetical protein
MGPSNSAAAPSAKLSSSANPAPGGLAVSGRRPFADQPDNLLEFDRRERIVLRVTTGQRRAACQGEVLQARCCVDAQF